MNRRALLAAPALVPAVTALPAAAQQGAAGGPASCPRT
jgi:hypothetical protein